MEDNTTTFSQLRPRLLGVAYRMLGSLAEAEDVVQDAWLGWNEADHARIADPTAWLVTTTTRRSIDRLRKARVDREHYVGIWLPEPVLTDGPPTPEELQESASDLSVAFLTVLERLAPEARAAFLLRDVLDVDYPVIAATLDKSEAAVRQIVHRARSQLREERPRYAVSPQAHQRVLRQFAQAWSNSDFQAMKALMADEATLVGDGGGIVNSFPKPMVGGLRIAQLLYASTLRPERGMRIALAMINGQLGVLRYFGDQLESAQSYEITGGRIVGIQVQRNPNKLQRVITLQSSPLH
jgi:RNA polymerase sigma-70 factor (ECF subfamily)